MHQAALALRVAAQAALLAAIFSLHIAYIATMGSEASWVATAWVLYASWWCCYHTLEFVMVAVFNPELLKWNSFLIDQSKAYMVAVTVGVCEFWLGALLAPEWKASVLSAWGGALMITGAVIMWAGQAVRSTGMATAGFAFTHIIQTERRTEHKLVQHGIYSLLRHPGYTGWFYAVLGTQVVLGNPVSFILYAAAAWTFFNQRIDSEEWHLFKMFKQDYLDYRRRSWVCIPCLSQRLSDMPGA